MNGKFVTSYTVTGQPLNRSTRTLYSRISIWNVPGTGVRYLVSPPPCTRVSSVHFTQGVRSRSFAGSPRRSSVSGVSRSRVGVWHSESDDLGVGTDERYVRVRSGRPSTGRTVVVRQRTGSAVPCLRQVANGPSPASPRDASGAGCCHRTYIRRSR